MRNDVRPGEGRAPTFSLTGFMFPPPQVGHWSLVVLVLWAAWLSLPAVGGRTTGTEGREVWRGMGVRTGAQEVWREILGRRKLGWCWELEERRGERKSTLRLRLATGRGRGTQRAKLWRGG